MFSALGFLLKALARGAFPAQCLMSRAQFCGAVLRGMEMAPCQHESLPLNMREPISPQGRAQSTLDEGVWARSQGLGVRGPPYNLDSTTSSTGDRTVACLLLSILPGERGSSWHSNASPHT